MQLHKIDEKKEKHAITRGQQIEMKREDKKCTPPSDRRRDTCGMANE